MDGPPWSPRRVVVLKPRLLDERKAVSIVRSV